MKQHTLKVINNKYTLGILLGSFCVSGMLTLLYIGFGGVGIFLKNEIAFWISLVVSVLLAYAIIRQWQTRKSGFGATDAILTFFVAFISFWMFAYIAIAVSRL